MLDNYFKERYGMSDRRMSICMECDKLDKTFKLCRQCGCMMEMKTKLYYAECPLGKWKAEQKPNQKTDK
jgi:hypothetical protein